MVVQIFFLYFFLIFIFPIVNIVCEYFFCNAYFKWCSKYYTSYMNEHLKFSKYYNSYMKYN